MYPSDDFHPSIGFDGEAHDSLMSMIDQMRGYGATLYLDDGTEVEAVLMGSTYDAGTERLLTCFYRADGDWPSADDVPADRIEQAFAKRIQVS